MINKMVHNSQNIEPLRVKFTHCKCYACVNFIMCVSTLYKFYTEWEFDTTKSACNCCCIYV